MKKTAIILAIILVSCAAFARPKIRKSTITLGGATTYTNTIKDVSGYLDEIEVYNATDSTTTGTHVIAVSPSDSEAANVAAVNVATNAVTDSQTWRPRVDGTDVAAAALTSDPPWRRLLIGDTITWTVSSSPTNKVWKLRIKYDDGR